MGAKEPTVNQLAAEAWESIIRRKIAYDLGDKAQFDSDCIAIIESAIEKAIKPWRDAIGGISPVSEKPEKRNDILAEVEAKETGDSRAAHTSEPLLQKCLNYLIDMSVDGVNQPQLEALITELRAAHVSERGILTHDGKRDAMSPLYEAAHASEPESSFKNPDPLDERPNP